jgi:hypothetical protein
MPYRYQDFLAEIRRISYTLINLFLLHTYTFLYYCTTYDNFVPAKKAEGYLYIP